MKSLHDTDFAEWAKQNAAYIRTEQIAKADWENIAEELEDMARADKRALESRIVAALEHLIKLRLATGHMLEENRRGWSGSVNRQHIQIKRLLRDSPSLRRFLTAEFIQGAYMDAAKLVKLEYGLEPPAECPFSVNEVTGDFDADK